MEPVMLKRLKASQYIAKQQEQARGAFENHQIRHQDHRSWVCMRPHKDGGWDGNYWFEAVVLHGGTLLVNGDIDLMHFAYYGKFDSPEQVVRWMGGSRDLGYYVRQKAAIGMTLPSSCYDIIDTIKDDVWMDGALSYIKEDSGVEIDTSKPVNLDALPCEEWLKDMIGDVAEGRSVREMILDSETYCEHAYEAGAYEWGTVPAPRLILAHEALRRLVTLLDVKHAQGRATLS